MACDLDTILAEACTNKFLQLANTDPKLSRAVILQLLCDISGGGSATGIQASSQITLDDLKISYTIAHGLSSTPKIVRAVLVCVNPDVGGSGYFVTSELELPGSLFANISGGTAPQVWADPANLNLSIAQPFVGNESSWPVCPLGGGTAAFFTSFNNFKLKFYYA